MWKKKIVDP